MKLKDAHSITEHLKDKSFKDMAEPSDTLHPSDYLLYVKDTSYEDKINKLSLIIVSMRSHYVVNNNFRFNSLEIQGNEYRFHYMVGDKRKTTVFYA